MWQFNLMPFMFKITCLECFGHISQANDRGKWAQILNYLNVCTHLYLHLCTNIHFLNIFFKGDGRLIKGKVAHTLQVSLFFLLFFLLPAQKERNITSFVVQHKDSCVTFGCCSSYLYNPLCCRVWITVFLELVQWYLACHWAVSDSWSIKKEKLHRAYQYRLQAHSSCWRAVFPD